MAANRTGYQRLPFRVRMPGRATSLVARGRRLPWQMILAVALRVVQEGRKRWERLTKREQQELTRLVRKSKGRPARLTERERQEVWRIVRKAVGV